MDDSLKLQGTWLIASVTFAGADQPEEAGDYFRFHSNTLLIGGDQAMWEYQCHLDPTSFPKTLDIVSTHSESDYLQMAIYELDGDALRVCYAPPRSHHRPTAFVSTPANGWGILSLVRVTDDGPS